MSINLHAINSKWKHKLYFLYYLFFNVNRLYLQNSESRCGLEFIIEIDVSSNRDFIFIRTKGRRRRLAKTETEISIATAISIKSKDHCVHSRVSIVRTYILARIMHVHLARP